MALTVQERGQLMAIPAWARKHSQHQRAETTAIRAELLTQAAERVEHEEEEAAEQWTPRRGMSFASEGER